MRAILTLILSAATGLVALVMQPVGAAAETGHAAVWRPGSGAQYWRAGMTFDEMKAQDQTYFNQGLRITTLALDNGRFTTVWRSGTGAQYWRSGMTGAELETQDQTYFGQGLRRTARAIEGARYAAVWQAGTGAQWVSHSRCFVDLK